MGHNPLPWMDEDELKYRAEVPCYCGKQGCIETFISGTGFATDYHRLSGQPLKGNEIMRLVESRIRWLNWRSAATKCGWLSHWRM